jgi:hypothetical protein
MSKELKLEPRFRPSAEIAGDLARADADREALRLKLKRIVEGYKVQIEAKTKDLERLRDEFRDAVEAES